MYQTVSHQREIGESGDFGALLRSLDEPIAAASVDDGLRRLAASVEKLRRASPYCKVVAPR